MLAAFTETSRLEPVKIQVDYVLMMKGGSLVKILPGEYGIVINSGSDIGFDISSERLSELRSKM